MPGRTIPSLTAAAIAVTAMLTFADAPSASASAADNAWYSIDPSTHACSIPDRGPAEILASGSQIERYRAHDTRDPNTGAIVETTIEVANLVFGADNFIPLATFYRGAARCEAVVSNKKAALAAQLAAAQAAQAAAAAAAVAKYGAQPSPDQIHTGVSGDPAPGNDTAALSASERGAIGDHVRECWTKDAGALDIDKQRVMLTVTTDASGEARAAVVAGDDIGRLSDPRFRAFAERVRRAVLDPRCANLPLPNKILGKVNVITFRFSP
jgi:hypothetical protein